jgi:hypothetical protein
MRLGFTYHLYLEQRVVAVVQKIFRLSAVDTHDTEQKLATETECHDLDLLPHDSLCNGSLSEKLAFEDYDVPTDCSMSV